MLNITMQAISVHDYGGPEVLVLEQVPRPQPQPGQVLIHVFAVGVNPADWKFRSGFMKQYMPLSFPWIPGLEGAGTVEAIGEGVTNFQLGQAVYGAFTSSYAEYAVAAEGDVQPIPDDLSFEQAASVPVGALTAWGAVIDAAQVQSGQRLLVHGAAGGVGSYALQLARWKGAHVIGTASARNVEFVRSLGAEGVIDYHAAPFETVVRDLDVVIDTVGGDLPERSLKVLRPGGKLVTIAARLPPDMGKDQGIKAMNAGRAAPGTLKQISELIETKDLTPVVGAVFPLAEARQAHEQSETGHGRGRIILKIAE
ncbi:MAG TPA: NADP-dependent oxidoreductase [Anaerolineaceae bacterium]|jgi:NADPH:quinone reductase-like Zn-dependent oxidoreductase